MMASILDYPARKVFVKDLTKCVRLQTQGIENGGKKKQKEWKIECNGVEFIATVVWMQGLVTEVCDQPLPPPPFFILRYIELLTIINGY